MKLVKQLKTLQADSYILMLKTHSFHWNVTGPNFQSLHTLFETMYNELFLAVDTIAERIRALEELAVGSYDEFQKLSKIKDSYETKSKKMIKELIESNELLIQSAQELIKLAQKEGDEASADLAIERITVHQKNIWMLKAHLKE